MNRVAYDCAKTGVKVHTWTLALEGRNRGIRLSAVALGLVDMTAKFEAMQPKDLKRCAKREDIAAAAVFVASDARRRDYGADARRGELGDLMLRGDFFNAKGCVVSKNVCILPGRRIS